MIHSNKRQCFGTRMIAEADIRRVQEWMGHAVTSGHSDDDALPALCAAGGGRGDCGSGHPGQAEPVASADQADVDSDADIAPAAVGRQDG
jgi:hypothetical protein